MRCEPYANGQGWWHTPGCPHIDWEGDDMVLHTCPTQCDPDCEATCHETHQVTYKREHNSEDCPGKDNPGAG